MKRIALLLPVFNKLDYTSKCLESLESQIANNHFKFSRYFIVVVDDGSTDGTKEYIEKHHPEVIVLSGDGNLWWSGGINVAARYVIENELADFVLLWNNDIIAAADYFWEMDKLVTITSNNTLIGSKIYSLHTPEQVWSFGGVFNTLTGKKYMIGYDMPDSELFSSPQEADWLPGMGTLIPIEVITKIGYWDDIVFPQYHGDSDYTLRAKTAGMKNIVYPQLKLWNDKTNSGLSHESSYKGLYKMLTDKRSNSQIKKNFIFYHRHTTSFLAYKTLFVDYYRLIGGFFKWKVLSLFGIHKKSF